MRATGFWGQTFARVHSTKNATLGCYWLQKECLVLAGNIELRSKSRFARETRETEEGNSSGITTSHLELISTRTNNDETNQHLVGGYTRDAQIGECSSRRRVAGYD